MSGVTAEVAAVTAKVGPPTSVAGLVLAGVSLADWVLILTATYTLLQIGVLIYKFNKENAVWPRLKAALASYTKRWLRF